MMDASFFFIEDGDLCAERAGYRFQMRGKVVMEAYKSMVKRHPE